jgi:hypothetical protein
MKSAIDFLFLFFDPLLNLKEKRDTLNSSSNNSPHGDQVTKTIGGETFQQ